MSDCPILIAYILIDREKLGAFNDTKSFLIEQLNAKKFELKVRSPIAVDCQWQKEDERQNREDSCARNYAFIQIKHII